MRLKKANEFEDEVSFATYTLEMFIVSEICKKSLDDVNDLDVAKVKRELEKKGARLTFV